MNPITLANLAALEEIVTDIAHNRKFAPKFFKLFERYAIIPERLQMVCTRAFATELNFNLLAVTRIRRHYRKTGRASAQADAFLSSIEPERAVQ
jgi:hypothetical protein